MRFFVRLFCLVLAVMNFPSFAMSKNKPLASGIASYYANKFEGRRTANGERYRHDALTAAHRTAPFGTKIRVTSLVSGKSVVVRVNDRGPYSKGRVIDLSVSAARRIGLQRSGLMRVKLQLVR